MRSVLSWDDSVFAPAAAVVAAVTALFSGHAIFKHDPPPAIPISSPPAPDTGGTQGDSGVDSATPPARLCDQVRTKEGDVDAMNAQIDVLLEDVRAKAGQRRK